MKKRNLHLSMLIFTVGLSTSVLFQNCSPVSFKTAENELIAQASCGNTQGNDCQPQPEPQTQPLLTESFSVSSTQTTAPLDMIWVVDNSGSMKEEAANVRLNITNFVNSLDKSSDMKLLLVSLYGTSGTAVALPGGLDETRFMQKDLNVGSFNGPELLLTELGKLKMAGTPFFREISKKIIVFVTDDNSSLDAVNFSAGLQSVDAAKASIFGFIGLGPLLSKCQAATGTVYETLASETGGQFYNICDPDWTQNFSALKTDVLTKLSHSFTLQDPQVATIVKVEIDGAVIDASLYSFANGVLSVNPQVAMTQNGTVKVFYLQQSPPPASVFKANSPE